MLNKKVKKESVASFIMILCILLVLVIPCAFLVTKLVGEATDAYRSFLSYDFQLSNIPLLNSVSPSLVTAAQDTLDSIVRESRDYIITSAPDILGEIAGALLDLFIMFFIMYFAFMHGARWYKIVRESLPLKKDMKKHIFNDLEQVLQAIIYGQFLTAVIQGVVGGLIFFIFGIPNAVFWGFVMILFSFVPFLGTPLIMVPAGLIEIAQGNLVIGIIVIALSLVVVANLDNFIRPYLVSRFAPIHPIVVLVGVFGGLEAFGFAGMILGPLFLALFFTLIKDFASHKNLIA